jgi:hypothetical protein
MDPRTRRAPGRTRTSPGRTRMGRVVAGQHLVRAEHHAHPRSELDAQTLQLALQAWP